MESRDISDARGHYESQLERLDGEYEALRRRTALLSRARGIVFLVFLFLLICGWSRAASPTVCYWAAAALFVGFVTLVSRHDSLVAKRELVRLRQQYHRQQLARLDRDWNNLPVDTTPTSGETAVLARDLDLFGKASVSQLVAETHTPRGRALLSEWLAESAAPDEVVRRQHAVRWLAGEVSRRERVALAGRALEATGARPDTLLDWGRSAGWLSARPHVAWFARAIAVAIVGMTTLVFLQLIPAAVMLLVFLLIVVSLLFNAFYLGAVHDLFNRITVGRYEIEHYRDLFQAVWNLPPEVAQFAEMRTALGDATDGFEQALSRLQRLVMLTSGRRSGALSIVYIVVQLVVMWDFHALAALERWQRRYGPQLESWFESVAQLEALCSFGALSFNHPDWCFPVFDADREAGTFQASGLGHPLLSTEKCIRNDVAVGSPGTFLLVTGSNMSGKSTLLRSIGVNVVLAQAGSVVCATEMRLVPLRLATSMRIDDSLAEGVSFFMAELRRLKEVVEEARDCHETGARQLLFLLDEILQGTNSRERHLAVERILGHLVEMRATGAISTHDLELAKSQSLGEVSRTVHFRESFESGTAAESMVFDFRLREGVCPTTNALKLMELVGLS